MKILHLSSWDKKGGAAIAAYRLHLALIERKIDSKMLVLQKVGNEETIKRVNTNQFVKYIVWRIRRLKDFLLRWKRCDEKNKTLFSTGYCGFDLSENPYIEESDVIHLHWINGQYISLKTIQELAKMKKRIVWTLHDMWPLTGGCHYSGNCEKYIKNCGNCPVLGTKKESDMSRHIWKTKEKLFKNIDFKIVAPSRWLGKCAKDSSLFREKMITTIPYVVNVGNNAFKSLDKIVVRGRLNLELKKYYICFGALNATGDQRKGGKYSIEAIKNISKNYPELVEKVGLIIFGGGRAVHMILQIYPLKVDSWVRFMMNMPCHSFIMRRTYM